MKITTISTRILRSFDYCHFEISTSATLDDGDDSVWCADELRKQAARLADKAVQQYKIHKANRNRLESEERSHRWDTDNAERIKAKPEFDRSPQEQAELKAHQDAVWVASRRFDYEDEWDEDEAAE